MFIGSVYRRVSMLAATASLLCLSPLAAAQEDGDIVEDEDAIVEGQRCVSSRPIRKTDVLDDQNILFYMRGTAIYLNHLPKPCRRLAKDGRFIYRTTVARLCRSDLITVLTDSGFGLSSGPTCKLGTFYAITADDVEDLKKPLEVEPKTIPPAEPEDPGNGGSQETDKSGQTGTEKERS